MQFLPWFSACDSSSIWRLPVVLQLPGGCSPEGQALSTSGMLNFALVVVKALQLFDMHLSIIIIIIIRMQAVNGIIIDSVDLLGR